MPSCQQCRYSAVQLMPANPGQKNGAEGQLQCRFNPPSVHMVHVMTPQGPQNANVTVFPTVTSSAWCGRFEPNIKVST